MNSEKNKIKIIRKIFSNDIKSNKSIKNMDQITWTYPTKHVSKFCFILKTKPRYKSLEFSHYINLKVKQKLIDLLKW